jgi:hypothetical protein
VVTSAVVTAGVLAGTLLMAGAGTTGPADTTPPPPADAGSGPMAPASPVTVPPGAGGEHAFLMTDAAGAPVRFHPCEPISYVIREDQAPPGGVQLLRDGLAEVQRITGLELVDGGAASDVVPEAGYGRGEQDPPPVWIGFAGPDETSLLRSQADEVGVGGATSLQVGEKAPRYVTGFVVIRNDTDLEVAMGPGGTLGSVVLHEMGHLVGLGHVDDEAEIMFSTSTASTPGGYGPGDLEGLSLLGAAQGCA